MKLRVKGNSLIFRLTRTELTKLCNTGRIDETIYFSMDQDSKFVYALEHESHTKSVTLRYEPSEVMIVLPSGKLEEWIRSDQKVVYSTIDLGTRGAIELLIEKDYGFLETAG